MGQAAQLMPRGIFIFRVSRVCDNGSGGGININPRHARLNQSEGGFNRPDHRLKPFLDRFRWGIFSWLAKIDHPLDIRAVILFLDAEIKMQEMARLNGNISGGVVANR